MATDAVDSCARFGTQTGTNRLHFRRQGANRKLCLGVAMAFAQGMMGADLPGSQQDWQ
jgi:hypothetical protein